MTIEQYLNKLNPLYNKILKVFKNSTPGDLYYSKSEAQSTEYYCEWLAFLTEHSEKREDGLMWPKLNPVTISIPEFRKSNFDSVEIEFTQDLTTGETSGTVHQN